MRLTLNKKILIFSRNCFFRSDQSLSHVPLFATPWITARQASLSITSSRASLRLTSIESVMSSSHLILCRPLLLLPPIPAIIRVFSSESTLRMRWPKYWSFNFSIIPSTGNRTALWSSNPTAGHTHWGNQKGKRHVYPNVHRSTVYNSQDMEAT